MSEVPEQEEQVESKRAGKPGCLALVTVLAAGMLAAAIYLMSRWERLPGLGKAGSVVLAVIGTLLLLPFVILVGVRILIKTVFGRVVKDLDKAREQLKGAGDDIVSRNRAMYGQIHEFRESREDDFASLDRDFYESVTRQLSHAGFRHLGNIVDSTIEALNQPSPVIRVMVSSDGTTTAGFFHLNLPIPSKLAEGRALLICDLGTEFSDGTHLLTSNTAGVNLTTSPPMLHRLPLPLDTTIADELAAHEAEKQKLLSGKSGASCVVIRTLQDALESERRQQTIKNAFREGIGYVDPEEVRRIAMKVTGDDTAADRFAQAADEARRTPPQEPES